MTNTNTEKVAEVKATENSKVQELDLDQLEMVSGGSFLTGLIKVLEKISSPLNW